MCVESLWLAEKKREEGARPFTLEEINAATQPEPQTVQGDTYRLKWRPRITRMITLIFSSKLLQVEAFGEKDTHERKGNNCVFQNIQWKKIKMSSNMHGPSQYISRRNTLVIIRTLSLKAAFLWQTLLYGKFRPSTWQFLKISFKYFCQDQKLTFPPSHYKDQQNTKNKEGCWTLSPSAIEQKIVLPQTLTIGWVSHCVGLFKMFRVQM